jgi:hypothetical protein
MKRLIIGLVLFSVFTAQAADPRFARLDSRGLILMDIEPDDWDCVLDRESGLVWERKTTKPGLHSRDNTFRWYQPDVAHNGGFAGHSGGAECRTLPCDTHAFVAAVNRAGWCGKHDWRLPTREELRTLVDYAIAYPGPTLDRDFFPGTLPMFYWSADPSADEPREAWGMGFAHGFDYAYDKSNRVYVRLVSGDNATTNHFQGHSDGTVTDLQSGLRWARCSAGQHWDGTTCEGLATRVSWAEAQALARDGWRLPDIKELSGLAELRRTHPAIDMTVFPATPAADFWTATPYVNLPDQQWRVQFIYGESHPDKRGKAAFLRLVKDAD